MLSGAKALHKTLATGIIFSLTEKFLEIQTSYYSLPSCRREEVELSSGYYVAYSCCLYPSISRRCSGVYFYSCDIKLIFIPSTMAALVDLTGSLCLPGHIYPSAGCLTLLKMKVKERLKRNNCHCSNFFFVLKNVSEQEYSKGLGFFGQLFVCVACCVMTSLPFLPIGSKDDVSIASIKKQAEQKGVCLVLAVISTKTIEKR